VYNSVALCSTVYNYVTLCFTVYNSVALCFTVYNSVTLCFTVYNSVALCFTVYNSVALCFTVYNSVALTTLSNPSDIKSVTPFIKGSLTSQMTVELFLLSLLSSFLNPFVYLRCGLYLPSSSSPLCRHMDYVDYLSISVICILMICQHSVLMVDC